MHVVFHRLLPRVALALATATLVGGCEDIFAPPPAPPPPAPAPGPPPSVAPPRTVHVVPPPPPPAPAPPEVKVVGLSEEEVQQLLGDPTMRVDRPPAKVWQYRSGDCAVDIYFYLDVGRNAFYALHYDSPAPTPTGAPTSAAVSAHDAADRCLYRLYNAHREP